MHQHQHRHRSSVAILAQANLSASRQIFTHFTRTAVFSLHCLPWPGLDRFLSLVPLQRCLHWLQAQSCCPSLARQGRHRTASASAQLTWQCTLPEAPLPRLHHHRQIPSQTVPMSWASPCSSSPHWLPMLEASLDLGASKGLASVRCWWAAPFWTDSPHAYSCTFFLWVGASAVWMSHSVKCQTGPFTCGFTNHYCHHLKLRENHLLDHLESSQAYVDLRCTCTENNSEQQSEKTSATISQTNRLTSKLAKTSHTTRAKTRVLKAVRKQV